MRVRTRVLTSKFNQLKNAIRSLLSDFRPVWTEQTPIIRAEFMDQLKNTPHAPITRATRNWRRRRGYSPSSPPLQASHALENSLTSQNAPGAIEESQKKSLSIGTRLPQAAPNHFGALIKIRNRSDKQAQSGKGRKSKKIIRTISIPARPFVPDGTKESFAGKLSRQMENFLNRYLIQKLLGGKPE